MALIFVHGVNTRKENPTYETTRLATEQFLKKFLSGASVNGKVLGPAHVTFPYWGDLATSFRWNMKSLPSAGIDALGAPGVEDELRPLVATIRDALADPSTAEDQPLLTLARRSFGAAIDIAVQLILQNADEPQREAGARFIVEAQIYAARYTPPAAPPPWLMATTTDEQFIAQLVPAVNTSAADPKVDALGLFDPVINVLAAGVAKLKVATAAAAGKVLDKAGDFASTKVLAWSRRSLNETLGRFFGDVFVYMDERGYSGAPGRIPDRILDAWTSAIEATPGEPVIIIGHSLGGVISFDLLSHFRTDIAVDLFVSVGSQVSHFEEMKLFRASDVTVPKAGAPKAVKPENIKHWINVLDEVDIFSYACEPVFSGVRDLQYDTETYVIKAHGAYFMQARFYERLRVRLDALPVV